MRIFPIILMALLLRASLSLAAVLTVPAEPGALAGALSRAQAGDILRLLPGKYYGSFAITTPLSIVGGGRAEIIGGGVGSVIEVQAANVRLRGLIVTGSGSADKDAGINLSKRATDALVEGNQLLGNLIGVNLQGARGAIVRGNLIEGRQGARMNARGNGVYVWNAPGAKVIGNDIRWGRDGIFVNVSKDNEFRGNRFRDLRFAVHYMYVHDSIVADNISIGNHLGYAVMFSKNVTITGNLSRDDKNYGLMLNYTNDSLISGNVIERTEDRCVFIYNAHKNQLTGNRFEGCNTGIHFTAGSERNKITGNSFIANRTQVKYVGSKWVDWSVGGRGNYWSDHASFDLNGDGIADSLFRPNDAMDRVLWMQPAAKSLLGSPAIQLIRWSQSAFPALLPGGVIDRYPLMRPVEPDLRPWEGLK